MTHGSPLASKYAVACTLLEDEDYEYFFVSFNTRDEQEALDLAKCIVGSNAEKCLVVIREDGEIFEL